MRMLILFLCTTIHSVAGQDLKRYQKRTFVADDGYELLFRISFPKDYQKDVQYPVVLLLHGAGERGDDNESQLRHGAVDFDRNADEFPCILIVPQCPQDSYWSSVIIDRGRRPLGMNFDYKRNITKPLASAIALTRSVVRNEGGDRDRIYITGLSMGGMGTFEAIVRYPKLFAAAVPICGAGEASAFRKRHTKVPFWIFHGADDTAVSVEESRQMSVRLEELGGEVRYTEYPGVGHNSWDNAYKEPGLFVWLFSKKK